MAIELVTGTFEPHVGETFAATPTLEGGSPVELTLASCDESRHARPDQPAFSLSFRAPEAEPPQPQQIFTLRHQELGEFDLFLVPVGPHEYQAVIN
jgi:hypothetical protein